MRLLEKTAQGTILGGVLTLVAVVVLSGSLEAQTIGMVADDRTHTVTVFDADSDTVLGSVPLPGSGIVTGDCSITANQSLGYVTDLRSRVWGIDLTGPTPSLLPAPYPIPISNRGQDTSISPDEQFLVVCSAFQPVAVIDIATQTEIGTFSLGPGVGCNSVDVCSDGSVLVTSLIGTVRRLTIDSAGNLTDTGEALSSSFPLNAYCSPSSNAGVVVNQVGGGSVESFTIPGLASVDVRFTTGVSAHAGAINPAGDRVFVRTASGTVDAFGFNQATGALSATPLFTINVNSSQPFFGIDQIAVHPNGLKLYIPEVGALGVYDVDPAFDSGDLITSIVDGNIIRPTGVCFPATPPLE